MKLDITFRPRMILLLTGSLIPRTTISNAHPPLVMAYLALWWKIFGFSPIVTRTAMLLMSSFALLGLFRLAQRVANTQCRDCFDYLHGDLPSIFCAKLTCSFGSGCGRLHILGIESLCGEASCCDSGMVFRGCSHQRDSDTGSNCVGSLGDHTLTEALPVSREYQEETLTAGQAPPPHNMFFALVFPVFPLALWYSYHYLRTGFTFGNPEFLRYNVQATMHPLRMVLALLMRLWQTFGYMNLLVLTAAGVLAMWRPPLRDQENERPRIALDVQFAFLAVVAAYVLAMAVIGGAVLARYMLPAVPLVIVVFVSTLWRRIEQWRWVIAIVVLGFVAGLFINPPYTFSMEDNLAYRDYIQLHQDAEHFLEARYPKGSVLTAWPASDELTRPFLGYVSRPMRIHAD